jgi:hypothetical protein
LATYTDLRAALAVSDQIAMPMIALMAAVVTLGARSPPAANGASTAASVDWARIQPTADPPTVVDRPGEAETPFGPSRRHGL